MFPHVSRWIHNRACSFRVYMLRDMIIVTGFRIIYIFVVYLLERTVEYIGLREGTTILTTHAFGEQSQKTANNPK